MKNIFKKIIGRILKEVRYLIPSKENPLKKDAQYSVIEILPIVLIILAFFYNNPKEMFYGMINIILANDVFVTDYTYISNMGATLLNAGLVMLINIYILRRMDLKLNGTIISALFLLVGFSFIGKNIYNIWPFYVGGYIYSKIHDIDFKNTIVTSMYTTSLAPIISVISYTFSTNVIAAVILSYACGIFIGYVMPEISSRTLMAHYGYNTYNTGFASGFLAIAVNSIFNVFGMPVKPKNIVNPNFNIGLFILLCVYFIILIIVGYCHNNNSFSGYKKLLSYPGRLITDYTRLCSFPLTLINMGILGLCTVAYVVLMGGKFDGPTMAAIFTTVGFASFGNNPRNTVSIMLGVAIASKMLNVDMSVTNIVISGLFGGTLAPIVREFGFIYGLIIGPLHLALVSNIGSLHAGLNLYNNGLSGGIIAMIMVPILDAFRFEERR